jgi:hypothetical protein
MAGAFVAVANDPSASFWNPAGLATAGPAAATIESSRFRIGNQKLVPTPGPSARKSSFTSLGTWPFGLSFTTLQTTSLESDGSGGTIAQSLETKDFGVTVLQSIVQGVILGSTLRYVRGTVGSELVHDSTVQDALDHAADLKGGKTTGRFDYDVGLMIDMERVRVGFATHNLRSPTFPGPAGTSITLKRHTRMGIAVLPTDGLTLAMDLDLDTVDLRGGLRRILAFGGEEHLGSRLVVRGGIRWSLKGQRQQVLATGASFAIRPKFWLDGHYTQGQIDADRGFGLALRAGF